jgi:uncharacterized MAPEG superfamily protein
MPELLTHPQLRLLALVDVLLVLKMLAVGNYTSLLRLRRKVFATSEDYAVYRGEVSTQPDPDIERTRRAHQNDVENILPFFVASAFYACTEPSYAVLSFYLWGFVAARVAYSVFYLRAMQPHRTIAFTLGAVLLFAISATTLMRVL